MKKLIALFILTSICVSFSVLLIFYSENEKSVATSSAETEAYPVIIIDAGHGGFDGGACSAEGVPEKNINLQISLYLRDYLGFLGYKTIMTRETDTSLEDDGLNTIREKKHSDIMNRFKILQNNENSVFISIHQNHFSQEKYNGAQVFYSPQNEEESSVLAQHIQNSIVKNVQYDNDRCIKKCDSSVYLIYNAEKPAVLVECGFLSNIKEAENLQKEDYQKRIAFSIATGINDYLKEDKNE